MDIVTVLAGLRPAAAFAMAVRLHVSPTLGLASAGRAGRALPQGLPVSLRFFFIFMGVVFMFFALFITTLEKIYNQPTIRYIHILFPRFNCF